MRPNNFVVALVASFLALASTAQAVELRQATDQQLISELSRRLNGGDGGSNAVMVNLNCNSYQLQINLTSLNGTVGSDSMNFSSSSKCSNFISLFGSTVTLRGNKIIGACTSYQLNRKLLKLNATVENLPAINYNSSTECDSAASALNRP